LPAHAVAAGLLLSVVPAVDVDRQRRPPDAQHGAQQQMRAVPRCRLSYEAERRLVKTDGLLKVTDST